MVALVATEPILVATEPTLVATKATLGVTKATQADGFGFVHHTHLVVVDYSFLLFFVIHTHALVVGRLVGLELYHMVLGHAHVLEVEF
jgi:hypothetical protein